VLPDPRELGYRGGVPKLPWLLVVRIATLVALAAAAALLSDYTADAPIFCSAVSGCALVRQNPLSHLSFGEHLFVPLPGLGVAGFAALYLASLLSRRATQVAAVVGGVIALYLLYVQAFEIGHFCWLCVTTDVSAIVAAAAALCLQPSVWEHAERSRLRPWAWWAFGALAVAAPLAWPQVKLAPPVPSQVRARYVPGKINVVEFADFQCPACRMFSGILKSALQPYGDRVHFVRLNKPLSVHPFAEGAARAAVCAEAQHQAEPMAEALFAADDLSPAGIDQLARALSLDTKQFERCMLDAATRARVKREADMLVPPELEGLPTTYIGGRRLVGVQSAETVADALARAARGEGQSGISGYVYLPIVALLGLLVLRFGLRRAPT